MNTLAHQHFEMTAFITYPEFGVILIDHCADLILAITNLVRTQFYTEEGLANCDIFDSNGRLIIITVEVPVCNKDGLTVYVEHKYCNRIE